MNREELLKIGKPILFNTPMVQAILEGRKTVTRRVIKTRYKKDEGGFQVCTNKATGERWVEKVDENECGIFADGSIRYVNPPYQIGDILYVRETWCKVGEDVDIIYFENSSEMYNGQILYRADGIDLTDIGKWHPSIHMPKSAARIFLKVTDVRVERIRDITEEQARKEGCITYSDKVKNEKLKNVSEFDLTAKDAFIDLWNSTIKKQDLDQYGWEANPWVFVIFFERINDRW